MTRQFFKQPVGMKSASLASSLKEWIHHGYHTPHTTASSSLLTHPVQFTSIVDTRVAKALECQPTAVAESGRNVKKLILSTSLNKLLQK